MAITLRQESQTGTTTKGSVLTFAELDNNFIDLLTQKILPIQVDADTGSVNVGEAQSNGVLTLTGGTDITTTVTEDSAGNANVDISFSGSAGISNVVEDTTPQLGGMLDVNGNSLGDGTLELLKFSETGSAVNEFTISNNATGAGPTLSATGDDTNIDININPKGTGDIVAGGPLRGAELVEYKETVHTLSYAANITPDVANGNVQEITLTGSVNFQGFNNAADGQSMTLIIHQDGTGNHTFSEDLDSAGRMLFAGGTSTLSTAANAVDIMSIVYAGGIYYASLSTNFS